MEHSSVLADGRRDSIARQIRKLLSRYLKNVIHSHSRQGPKIGVPPWGCLVLHMKSLSSPEQPRRGKKELLLLWPWLSQKPLVSKTTLWPVIDKWTLRARALKPTKCWSGSHNDKSLIIMEGYRLQARCIIPTLWMRKLRIGRGVTHPSLYHWKAWYFKCLHLCEASSDPFF